MLDLIIDGLGNKIAIFVDKPIFQIIGEIVIVVMRISMISSGYLAQAVFVKHRRKGAPP
jgi:hypothetical protein